MLTRAQFSKYNFKQIKSNAGVRSDLFPRPLERTLLTDFFGGVAQAEVVDASLGMGNGGSTLSAPTVQEDAAWKDRHADADTPAVTKPPAEESKKTEGYRVANVAAALVALTALVGSAAWSA